MFRVIFKGDMEDIYLTDAEGTQLMQDIENNTLQGFIRLSGRVVDAKSIKAVMPQSSDPDSSVDKDRGMEIIRESIVMFDSFKQDFLNMPVDMRCKEVGLADMLSVALRGRRLTDEEKEEVAKRQRVFYEEHPDYAFANPICYKDLLFAKIPTEGAMIHVRDVVSQNALLFTEQLVRNGIKRFTDV